MQVYTRPKFFLLGWLLALSIKEESVRCEKLCDKSWVIQLRGNQKDFNFQLHHRLSKFEVPVVVNLNQIFELLGLYTTWFLFQKLLELIRLSSNGQFWRKSKKKKKGGNFESRSQLFYYNCTNVHTMATIYIVYFDICTSKLIKWNRQR